MGNNVGYFPVGWRSRVNTIRYAGWDYAQDAVYFVTTCTQHRERLFGHVEDQQMILNEYGRCVESAWLELARRFPSVDLDVFVIMPDHMHGIIALKNSGTTLTAVGAGSPRPAPTLGNAMAYFKYMATRYINEIRVREGAPVFQRGYHERIIRDDSEWNRISIYVQENPEKWQINAR